MVIACLIQSPRASISVEVTPQAHVIVRAPRYAPYTYVEDFLRAKTPWITRQVHQARVRLQTRPQHKFCEGEEFLYLGVLYPLRIVSAQSFPLTHTNAFFLHQAYRAHARTLLCRWYRQRAQEVISRRVRHWAAIQGCAYSSVAIRDTKSRWGSCGPHNSLNFAWRLVMAPLTIIDYVVVHELCHIQHKNHARRFWQAVEKVLPQYRSARQALHEQGYRYTI